MSNAALIALTSPLLMAQASELAFNPVEQPRIEIAATLASTDNPRLIAGAPGLMGLQWALAAEQSQEQAPGQQAPDTEPPKDEGEIVVE
ncbi:MAG: hypothetical protein HRT64_10915, partial [Erythrobacter sp.]|nr:hypothetical protein [Erythrobacter sp.]